MPELSHFPIEILVWVTGALDGFAIGRLWLTGNQALMVRLEQGGVVRFDLAIAQTVTRKWPALISRFQRLEYLRIVPRSSIHRIWFSCIDLSGISRNLKHLELEFDNLEIFLFGLPFVVPDAYSDPIWSPDTKGEMVLSPFSLDNQFPNLETLGFSGDMSKPHLLVPLLPKSLLALNLPYSSMNTAILHQLPRNLTHLKLPYLYKIVDTSVLPSNLTSLIVPQVISLPESSLSGLPPLITDLDVNSYYIDEKKLKSLFLPRLKSLKIDAALSFSADTIQQWSSLLDLTCNLSKWDGQNSLPANLRSLNGWYLDHFGDNHIINLPQTLTSIDWSILINPASLKLFSFNLRFLDLEVNFCAESLPCAFLPNLEVLKTTSLELDALKGASKLRVIEVGDLSWVDPSILGSLTSLTSIEVTEYPIPADEAFLSSLSPIMMKKLSFSTKFLVPPASLFPRSLQHLYLGLQGNHGIDDAWMAHLPPALIGLSLFTSDFPLEISDTSISLLPRTLETISLGKTNNITDNGIQHLPHGLIECNLSGVSSLSNACFIHLPRRLQHLHVQFGSSMQRVEDLPRTLRTMIPSFLMGHKNLPPALSKGYFYQGSTKEFMDKL